MGTWNNPDNQGQKPKFTFGNTSSPWSKQKPQEEPVQDETPKQVSEKDMLQEIDETEREIAYYEYLQSLREIREFTVEEGTEVITSDFFPEEEHSETPKRIQKVNLPSSLREIEDNAFECMLIREMTIPEGVTTIGYRSFSGCDVMKTLTLPSTLTSVGKEAFYGCRYLESVTIPASLEVIPEGAFRNCRDLKHITIEDGVRKVEADAFMGCKQLESVVLPNSVTACDFFSFGGCDNMKSIVFSEKMDVIPISCCNGCDNLEQVTLPSGLIEIGPFAFKDCPSLKELMIPDSVENIMKDAFRGDKDLIIRAYADSYAEEYADEHDIPCHSIVDAKWVAAHYDGGEKLVIPDTVYEIADETFYDLPELKSVEIPSEVKVIAENAFDNGDIAILGEKGSAAKKFASKHDMTFVDVNKPPKEKKAKKPKKSKKKKSEETEELIEQESTTQETPKDEPDDMQMSLF